MSPSCSTSEGGRLVGWGVVATRQVILNPTVQAENAIRESPFSLGVGVSYYVYDNRRELAHAAVPGRQGC